MKRRQILAVMICGVGQLRNAEIVWPVFLALVDGGIDIDEMPAGRARAIEKHLDVSLAVNAAGVADVVVVIDDGVDVGRLGPADALQMHGNGRSRRASRRRQGQGARQQREVTLLVRRIVPDPQAMGAAEIVGRLEREGNLAARVGGCLRDVAGGLVEAAAAHAIAAHGAEGERVGLAGRQPLAARGHGRVEGREGGLDDERARRRQAANGFLRLFGGGRRQDRRARRQRE